MPPILEREAKPWPHSALAGDGALDTRGPSSSAARLLQAGRPAVQGKCLVVGDGKFYVRGVTYGPFRPDPDGTPYRRSHAARAFELMARNGVNAVRLYTVPPAWLLDTASQNGLRVMVGLPWEQHVAFLDDRQTGRTVERRVRAGVQACAGHPAVLCYAIGNEIPTAIVRWHGPRAIERFLDRLCHVAKQEDPGGLVTYVNYPSTEYLQVPAADFCAFNVYLESPPALEAYLARLQNLAGNRPLVMGELGLDSRRHGEAKQAETLEWQVRTAFHEGCAGAFVFSWTDEWHRGGCDIEDWDFGLTRRDGVPKPALASVSRGFAEVPFASGRPWPRISVVVCVFNGEDTLRECIRGLQQLDYPDYEVIIVDDGSTDTSAAIAGECGCRVIRTENRGLSNARNSGMDAATGEIVAYLDSDARPDPQWLTYLAHTFMTTSHAAVGGPNIAPPGDGFVSECVARSPGNPVHVLLSDRVAEHIPGCNLAVRKAALQQIGGFDGQFRIAADDVDACWRLQDAGGTLGFNSAAVVWHHCRQSIGAYLRQQKNYGRAEAMLERKWPEKYNALGHLTWSGRMYGTGDDRLLSFGRWRIYHGVWGSGLFQSVYERRPGRFRSLFLVPEWYLVMAGLCFLAGIGHYWPTLTPVALALIAAALVTFLGQAFIHALRACSAGVPESRARQWRLVAGTTVLHVLQPLARLWGRYSYGLRPFRARGVTGFALPRSRRLSVWSERWRSGDVWLGNLETALRKRHAVVSRGGDFDRWDLRVQTGFSSMVHVFMAIEEHGAGKQLVRFRCRPQTVTSIRVLVYSLCALGLLAELDNNSIAFMTLGFTAGVVAARAFRECGATTAAVLSALAESDGDGRS